MVKRLRKLVQYIRRYSTKYAKPRRDLFSAESTRPIYTNILHDIVALVALFNLAHTDSECQSDESGEFAIFFHKIGCHGNVP